MKKAEFLMNASIICIAISSLSLIGVSFADFSGSAFQRTAAYATGIVFWVFLIAGYVLLFAVSKQRKQDKDVKLTHQRPGIINFFSGKAAIIADFAMFAAIILFLIFMFVPKVFMALKIVSISLLVLTVQLHAVLNGVNYRYICKIRKKSKEKESKV